MYIPRNPYFSEFSYGYALTDNLVAGQGSSVAVAPIFPSLIEEGQVGFEVLIARPSIPLFLQFKLAHRMTRRSASEAQAGDLDPPFSANVFTRHCGGFVRLSNSSVGFADFLSNSSNCPSVSKSEII